jgi:glycosyltransferase involved in cell wall biosynthesis
MVTAAPFLISYLLSLFKIKQALWYSHSIADRRLSVVLNNIDYVFTPTSDSFPIESSKVKVMGHGVDSGRFKYAQSSKRFGVISTGRIVPVKRIELFIEAFSNLDQVSRDYFKILTLVGDDTIDPDYVEFLKSIAREKQLDLRIVGQVSRSELPSFLNASDFYYMGTPKSLDKSAIEAAMCGCILICDSQSSLSSVGLSSNVIKSGDDSKLAIVKLMNQYLKFDVQRIRELQFETAIYSANNNDIGKLSQRIYDTFRND